jgi:glycosyltransferase involved in cell wall biosynthesis
MNLIYFNQHFTTPKGSAGIRSYEMAKRCIEEGHEVTIVCGSYQGGVTGLNTQYKWGKRIGYVDGIKVIEFDLKYSNNHGFLKRTYVFLLYSFKSVWLALTLKYDVVFASTTPLTAGIPGIFARLFRRKKFVFEVRDLWPELPKAMGVIKNPVVLWIMKLLEWVTYHSANKLIGLSPGICEGIMKTGIPKERIIQISNGCDVEMFEDNVEEWLPDDISEQDLKFIYSGTHGIANGLDSIINGLIELEKRGVRGFKFILIGSGKEKTRLINRAHSELKTNCLVFLDPVPKLMLIGLLKKCDIGLQILANVPAFYYGTSPNKFFDYLAMGMPVLTNYPGWVSDLIEKNNCGFSVEPDCPENLADTIEEILRGKYNLALMRNNSKQLAINEFNRRDLSGKWVSWVLD